MTRTVYLYTDGGIAPTRSGSVGLGGAGAFAVLERDGVYAPLFEASSHCPTETTNQRMELEATILGLELLRPAHAAAGGFPVVVRSDSAYVVNCIEKLWWLNWMTRTGWVSSERRPVGNADLWRRLLGLQRATHDHLAARLGPCPWRALGPDDAAVARASLLGGMPVAFQKVKGHSGDAYNGIADDLATDGKGGKDHVRHIGAGWDMLAGGTP